MRKLKLLFFLILFLFPARNGGVYGQELEFRTKGDSTNQIRKISLFASAGVFYAGSLVGLNALWYKDYPRSHFHFINDNREWLQMDKLGHSTSCYYIGKVGYEALKWAGVNEKKAVWLGGISGLVYLSTVETFDGFSEQWGASSGDMLANGAGTALFIGQQFLWHEQKLQLKWSFHLSKYSKFNPKQLGNSFTERMLKDYNGQTYWLSANIASLGLQQTAFPKWLNIAIGYSAEGMTGGYSNSGIWNGLKIADSERKRQFYISPDIDLSKIKVKSETLHLILSSIGFIKIPMPALEFCDKGVRFLPIYF